MSPDAILEIVIEAFKIALMLSMPMMLATLSVGVLVSIFQSVTSIQEQTMVFVPKILAVFVTLLVSFSWMLGTVMNFTTQLFKDIPALVK